ncbi:tRNA (guanosine(37)-N1)-methyltransferase TrmD [bacterium]|nr:tRNA (guanosine(37)-N1)-methyltransferase TrmD [bacterium]
MQFDILTLFPEMFEGFLEHSIVGRARQAGQVNIQLIQWRNYATDRHRVVDDSPYGGGAGMVLKCEPLFRAIEDLRAPDARPPETQVIYLTPQGELFNQEIACDLAERAQHLILVCGRYEGVDERARVLFDREISIGDYVLTGGELAAGIVADAVTRLIPGVLGNDESAQNESHMEGIFDYPHYTRPEIFRDMAVPPLLLGGHHAKIVDWRREHALRHTLQVRPDLIEKADLSEADRVLLEKICQEGKAAFPESD